MLKRLPETQIVDWRKAAQNWRRFCFVIPAEGRRTPHLFLEIEMKSGLPNPSPLP
jgi:hypothetical protein